MVTFAKQKIEPAAFTGLRSRLVDGVGFFEDAPFKYGVFDSDQYRVDVVRRTSAITFTQTIAALPQEFKAVINGNYFFGNSGTAALYGLAAFGVVDPVDVQSRGDVKQGGSVVLPDAGSGVDYFFFGRDNTATPAYDGGQGNPPGSVFEGMGGLGPLILPNPVTGAPLKFGVGNKYASNPKKTSTPTSPADFRDLVQRNNNTYASLKSQTAGGDGICAIAVISTDRLIVMLAKRHGVAGDLDALRDKLFSVDCTVACFTDGSSSVTMAVDRTVVPGLAPAGFKDNLIETGFGTFLYRPPPAVNLRVTFTEIRVRDDEEIFGSGSFTVRATVNGTTLSLLNAAPVDTGDVVSMSFNTTVTIASGGQLRIALIGTDADDGDELGTVNATFSATSTPRFGVGQHTRRSSRGSYEVTFRIDIVP